MTAPTTKWIVTAIAILFGSDYPPQPKELDATVLYGKISDLGEMLANSLQNACEARDIDSVLKFAALVDEYFAKDESPCDDGNGLVSIVKTSKLEDRRKANSQLKTY